MKKSSNALNNLAETADSSRLFKSLTVLGEKLFLYTSVFKVYTDKVQPESSASCFL